MANIAAQRIKREFKEVIKSEEVRHMRPYNYLASRFNINKNKLFPQKFTYRQSLYKARHFAVSL